MTDAGVNEKIGKHANVGYDLAYRYHELTI